MCVGENGGMSGSTPPTSKLLLVWDSECACTIHCKKIAAVLLQQQKFQAMLIRKRTLFLYLRALPLDVGFWP